MPQGAILEMLAPLGLMQAVRIATQVSWVHEVVVFLQGLWHLMIAACYRWVPSSLSAHPAFLPPSSPQALLPSMTDGFEALVSLRSMAPGPPAGPQPSGWGYAPPPASPYGPVAAGGSYPQPPMAPGGYAAAAGWQGAGPSYPAAPSYPPSYPPSATAYPPPVGWATGGPPATAPPPASPLQAGLSASSDCSTATQDVPSAPPLPGKEAASGSKFPAIV